MHLHLARGACVALLLALSLAHPAVAKPAVAPTDVVADPVVDDPPDSCSASPEEAMLNGAEAAPAAAAAAKGKTIWRGGTDPLPPPVKPENPKNGTRLTDLIGTLSPKLGLKCALNVYYTDVDIQRPIGTTGTPGTGSGDDPTGWTTTWKDPDAAGGCTCNVILERLPFCRMKPPKDKEMLAHELCHCLQAQKGEAPIYDPATGKWTTGTADQDARERGADACAQELLNGRKPVLTVPAATQ
jgi:hypothetical protein